MDKLLNQVKAEFKILHATSSPPSKSLRNKVVKLLDYYPRKLISEAINIKPGILSNWKTRNTNKESKEKTEFIDLPVTPIIKPVVDADALVSTKLSLALPNKINLLIESDSLKDSAKIIHYVVEEFSLCSI